MNSCSRKLEIEVRRLEGKISDEKNGIGRAVFPLLEAGTLAVDNADVSAHMSAIATIGAELAAKRKEIQDLGDDESKEADKPAESTPAS